jgi:hypothetical protein
MAELIPVLSSLRFTQPVGLLVGVALAVTLVLLQLRRRRDGLAFDGRWWGGRVKLRSNGVWVMTVLVALAVLLMVAALGAPEVVATEKVYIYGKPVVAVIDVSGSMDYVARSTRRNVVPEAGEPMSNLDQARAVFNDILSRDLGMDFGVLLYSTENYVARYFAFKKDLIRDSLDNEEEIAFISRGTRTADALIAARHFLAANAGEGEKAILLVSDLQGDLEAIVATAEQLENCLYAGIKVYVIMIGDQTRRTRLNPVPLPDVEGVMMVERTDKAGVDRLANELAQLPDSPVSIEAKPVRRNVTPWLAGSVLGLLLLTLILSETRFRKLP